MKRLLQVLALTTTLFALSTNSFATEHLYWQYTQLTGRLWELKVDWKCAAGGTLTATALTARYKNATETSVDPMIIPGAFALLAVTDPGTDAPADNYEVKFTDALSSNIFGTALDACDTSTTEQWLPTNNERPFRGPITFDVESAGGALGADDEGIAYFYFWMDAK